MSGSDSSDEIEQVLSVEKPKKRKGAVNSDLYKRNVIKKARLTGTEYVNYAGKTVAARTTGEHCKCKMKCLIKFKDDDFISILKGFSSFKNKDSQDTFLQGLIKRHDVQKRRKSKNRPNTDTDTQTETNSTKPIKRKKLLQVPCTL